MTYSPAGSMPSRLDMGALGPGRRLADIQRARIVTATVQVACERGAANLSVAHVVDRAGVSRRTFYELFGGCDECLLAAFEDAVSQIKVCVVPAFERGDRWREKVRGALVELLAFCEREPQLARVALVESAAGGAAVFARRSELLVLLAALVCDGRGEVGADTRTGGGEEGRPDRRGRGRLADDAAHASLAAEGVVGGVIAVLSARLTGAGAEGEFDFLALTGPLMSMIVLPYLGATVARQEAARAVPAQPESPPAQDAAGIEFHDLGIRLTYRTLRALTAIAQRPGESNRAIGECSGMSDQGQISKLLSRLQGVGLIENTGAGPSKGGPNAWALTKKGAQIIEGLRIGERS